MKRTETSSPDIASIAGRGLRDPGGLNLDEIQQVCASVLTQVEAQARYSRVSVDPSAATASPPMGPSPGYETVMIDRNQPGEEPLAQEVPNTPDRHESVNAVKGQEPRA